MPSDAFSALWSVIGAQDGEWLLIDWADGSRRENSWFPADHADRFEAMLAYHQREGNDPRVGLVPRRDKHPDGVSESSVLWAVVENPVSVRSLQAFRPQPTLVFKRGRVRTCVWWLSRRLPLLADPSLDWLSVANKRLAFALKANSARCSPEFLMPLADLVEADPSRRFEPAEIVGRLKDAPVRGLRSVPPPIIGVA